MHHQPLLSVVVPLHNEAAGILLFHERLVSVLHSSTHGSYEIIYCDDGSEDSTVEIIHGICTNSNVCKLLTLSRNFGKEQAVLAGIDASKGQAVLIIDGDGQHPIDCIPLFIKAWQNGAQVVVGQRTGQDSENLQKRIFSKLFYLFFSFVTGKSIDATATDYRLLDREVITAYQRLPEADRMSRVLIDWLGFQRASIPVQRPPRIAGNTSYNFSKLTRLALDTLIAASARPR